MWIRDYFNIESKKKARELFRKKKLKKPHKNKTQHITTLNEMETLRDKSSLFNVIYIYIYVLIPNIGNCNNQFFLYYQFAKDV